MVRRKEQRTTLKKEILDIIEKYTKDNGEINIQLYYNFEDSFTEGVYDETKLDKNDEEKLCELMPQFKYCEDFLGIWGYGKVTIYFHKEFKLTCCFESWGYDDEGGGKIEFEITNEGFEKIKFGTTEKYMSLKK